MPKISIVTTTYKHQEFISQTIESILTQTYTDWELLIGDDSPDNQTRNIIQQYVKQYPDKIKARHHSPSKGIVDNMSFLIWQASPTSEYIAFLEGDDMYTPDNLQKKIEIFEKRKGIKLVYSDLDFITAKGDLLIKSYLQHRRIPLFQNELLDANRFLKYTTGPIASRSTGMIEKSILNTILIRSISPEKKNYQVSDYDFYFQIATKYPIYGISDALTKYRRHENNLSGKNGGTSADLEHLISYYRKEGRISDNTYKKKLGWIMLVYSFGYFELGNKKAGFNHLLKSFKYGLFTYAIYKIFLISIYILPKRIGQKIIKKVIGRS